MEPRFRLIWKPQISKLSDGLLAVCDMIMMIWEADTCYPSAGNRSSSCRTLASADVRGLCAYSIWSTAAGCGLIGCRPSLHRANCIRGDCLARRRRPFGLLPLSLSSTQSIHAGLGLLTRGITKHSNNSNSKDVNSISISTYNRMSLSLSLYGEQPGHNPRH